MAPVEENELDGLSQDDMSASADLNGASEGSSTGRNTEDKSSDVSREEASKFVKKESRHVLYLRILVLLLLFSLSAVISVVVYFISDSGEHDSFESQYYAAAEKVTESFVNIASDKLNAAGSLVVAMVAHGKDHQLSWPFVALSSFQQRSATVMKLSGALSVDFTPIVRKEKRLAWENFTMNHPEAQWYLDAIEYQKTIGIDELDNRPMVRSDDPRLDLTTGIANYIYDFDRDTMAKAIISPEADWYLPVWQTSPVTKRSMVNQNRISNSLGVLDCINYHVVVLEGMHYSSPGWGSDDNPYTAEIAWLLSVANRERTMYVGDIFTPVYFPVYSNFDTKRRETVGVMRAVIHWARYFAHLLPESIRGLDVVLQNDCDEPFTYRIDGAHVVPRGHGDLHDRAFNHYMRSATFADIDKIEDGTEEGMKLQFARCPYSIKVYPSAETVGVFSSNTPVVITVSVALVFLLAVLTFFAYDRLVERRQSILMDKAKRTHMIVASLFPKNVRDQILNEAGDIRQGGLLGAKRNLRSFVSGGLEENPILNQMPIADLYKDCTVMFADIAGFTSWASSREPTQVFILLQTLYHAMDEIAKKRKVFKVETIGDSYVACAGVPEPEPSHGVKMARFAWDCLVRMRDVTRELETQLGPDTADLTMRFGLNSGPVTAGVLRGAQSRFQLFGDTVNTAARMESTGVPGRIQCSQSTAEHLIRSGKEHWLQERKDRVTAKGKGIMKTFFLTCYVDREMSSSPDNNCENDQGERNFLEDPSETLAKDLLKREREIEWVAELMRDGIRKIVAHRISSNGKTTKFLKEAPGLPSKNSVPLDEVVDVLKMPNFDSKLADADIFDVKMPDKVSRLVREYVSVISAAYKNNSFHNFEHACHVTLCVSKFLKRIVTPELSEEDMVKMRNNKRLASHLHAYTHGINSDPIALFAIMFSALIHDVDHPGVSNKQLNLERPDLARRYQKKSVAEQNSLDVAWSVLVDPHFRELREYIFPTSAELARFRQVVVNIVLATDIFDPELNELRKRRWVQAFAESTNVDTANDARATVVIETIMQASDVCHTMQHWHVYKRFNQKLFQEIFDAFLAGRCGSNPAEFWYEGELKFFDNYVIPLAQKLRDCGIFGVSSDECLNFALQNRLEWEQCGKAAVAEYLQAYATKQANKNLAKPHGAFNLFDNSPSSCCEEKKE